MYQNLKDKNKEFTIVINWNTRNPIVEAVKYFETINYIF